MKILLNPSLDILDSYEEAIENGLVKVVINKPTEVVTKVHA